MGKISIDEDYLKELTDFVSKSLVGKLLKRFEIIEDKNIIKVEAKELIYESFRDLRSLIDAHTKGLNITQFNFTKPRED